MKNRYTLKTSMYVLLAFICLMAVSYTVYGQDRDIHKEILVYIASDSLDLPVDKRQNVSLSEIRFNSNRLRKAFEEIPLERMSKTFPEADNRESIVENEAGIKIKKPNWDRVFTIELTNTEAVIQAMERLKKEPAVVFVEPHSDMSLHTDDQYPQQWHLNNTGQTLGTPDADIDAPEAWQIYTGSSSVTLGVIDTGVETNHDDLTGKSSGDVPESYPYRGYAHGTHVAGIAGAKFGGGDVRGVDDGVQILSGKVFSGYRYDPYSGQDVPDWGGDNNAFNVITDAVDSGAGVLNHSYGGSQYSTLLRSAFAYTYKMNRVSVASMGNDDTSDPRYPAAFGQGIIAVGSTTHNDVRSGFSNQGNHIDVTAPGSSILSTWRGNDYEIISGTSMAAPGVSGIATLLKGYNSSLYNDDIENIIRLSADKVRQDIYTYDSEGWNDEMGYGRANAHEALMRLQSPYVLNHHTTSGGTDYSSTGTYTATFFDVPGLANGNYVVKRHEVRKSVSFSEMDEVDVWCRGVATDGFSAANPNFGMGWCEPVSVSSNGATLRTYVYEVWTILGQWVGWYPTTPSNVKYAYTVHGKPYTQVSGDINSATTWKGVVHLINTIEVDNNATLTVEPGTTVLLDENVILRIRPGAKIIAEGTEYQPVRFQRADPAKKWNKIDLRSSAGNSFEWVLFDGGDKNVDIVSKNNTFKHITSRNGWRGINGWHNADGSGNASADISYALIEDNTSVGVVSHFLDLEMSYTTIQNNAQAGLYISSNTVYPFHHNVVSGNGGTSRDGIEIPFSSGVLYMQGSGYSEGYNQIHDNGDDQISNSGDLIVGNVYPQTGGYNSLEGSYSGSNYFVDNNSGTTVYAEYVWWGQYPAHPNMMDGPVQYDLFMQTSDPTLSENPGDGGQTPSKQRSEEQPLPQQITEAYYEASQRLGRAETPQQIRDDIYRLYQLAGLANDEQVKRDFSQRIRDIAQANTRIYSADNQHTVLQDYAQVLYAKSLLREGNYGEASAYLSEWEADQLTGHDRKDYLSLKAMVETYGGAYEAALSSLEALYTFQSTFEQNNLEEVKAQYAPLEEDIRRRMKDESSSGATKDKEAVHNKDTNELTAQNYPNPFNPTTNIRFSLPERSKVRLVVYDMLGREVATLVDGVRSAGQQTVSFDASNLSNGMYLYKLRAGGKEIVKKMTLIK